MCLRERRRVCIWLALHTVHTTFSVVPNRWTVHFSVLLHTCKQSVNARHGWRVSWVDSHTMQNKSRSWMCVGFTAILREREREKDNEQTKRNKNTKHICELQYFKFYSGCLKITNHMAATAWLCPCHAASISLYLVSWTHRGCPKNLSRNLIMHWLFIALKLDIDKFWHLCIFMWLVQFGAEQKPERMNERIYWRCIWTKSGSPCNESGHFCI